MKVFISIFLLLSSISSACLPEATLKSLGFSGVTAATKNSDYCTGIYDTAGACVSPDSYKTKAEEANAALREAYKSIEATQSYMDEILGFTEKILAKQDDPNATEAAKAAFKVYQDGVENNKGPCLEALQKMQNGFLCYTSSGNASEQSVDTDTVLSVNTTQTALANLDKCYFIFIGFCLMSSTNNPAAQFNPNSPPINAELDKRCKDFNADPCGPDNSAECKSPGAAIGKYFFEVNDINFYPTAKQVDEAKEALKQALDLIEQFLGVKGEVKKPEFNFSGLAATGTTSLTNSDSGVDVYKFGTDSKITIKGASVLRMIVVGLFVWLI